MKALGPEILTEITAVPTVSVLVVAALGEEVAFTSSLQSQNYDKPFEVVVVQGGNRSQARNIAIAASRAPLIAFIDADCEAPPDWLRTLVRALPSDETTAGVGGVSERHDSSGSWQKAIDTVFSTYLGTLDSPSLISVPKLKRRLVKALSSHSSLFRRDVLIEVGGYDERFELNEDTDLSARLREKGYKLILDRSIYVYHRRRAGPASFAKQFFRYGVGRMRSMLTHSRYVDLRILCLFIGATALASTSLIWPTLVLFVSAVYFVAIFASSLIAATQIGLIRLLPKILMLFPVEHFSYLAGMLAGLLLGSWSPARPPRAEYRIKILHSPNPSEPQ